MTGIAHHRRKTDPTQLLRFIENEHAGEAGIVYRQSRNGSMKIASTLADHGPEGAGLRRWTRPFDSSSKFAFCAKTAWWCGSHDCFWHGHWRPTCALWRTWTSPRTSGGYYQETDRGGVTGCRPTRWMVWPAGRGQPAPDD
jgi:ATP-dependent DNA helicase RecQ